ncbi:hypothetical protein CDD81_531 [Ophiocordyceps australis]|uniref:Glutathione S-transferase UstS-like C-terminal domain-containing protein n=1 Tax=Ophiocordyceps australis TaxID=1399860 RepID=A0A2C5YE78_9HYPO|nr:hypothetical protein CDD81_531 [Ophiocordyceps australis]
MASDQAGQKQLVFYDIASGPPRRTFAPNPWKSRLALNFKSASYSTNWVELPDVTPTRQALGIPVSRKLPNGQDFNTLPIIYDSANKHYVGDSFDIAIYLDAKYPSAPRLIPAGAIGVTRAWNDRINDLFSRFVGLGSEGMPFNPANAEQCRQILVDRARILTNRPEMTWQDCIFRGEARVKMLADFKAALGELEQYYASPDTSKGAFINGEEPCYADMIVGGWLGMVHVTFSPEDLQQLHTWHNGRWGKIWKGLAPFTEIVE